jgi:hypothetical protein
MGISHAERFTQEHIMKIIKSAIAVAVGTLFAGAALAQSNYSIEQRDRSEQARIDRGVQSGQITAREAARLQGERAQIERLESRARADGNLSRNERARIDGAQDRLSRDIYRESHDRQTTGSSGRPNDRQNGWGQRHGNDPRHSDNRGGGRNDWRGNGASAGSSSNGHSGRSDYAPGRQPHAQQSASQRTHVQQAQARTGGSSDRRTR